MNKIKVVDEQVLVEESDELIEVTLSDKLDIFDIIKLRINVIGNTDIQIYYENSNDSKLDVLINLKEDVCCNIYELKKENDVKIQYKYYLGARSNLQVHKFYNCNIVKELDIIELNGEYANIYYKFHTISTDCQKYDLVVYHNSRCTKSNIINKGVNIKNGSLFFNVTSVVYNGIIDCDLNQNNRIITMNDRKCNINPNLLIEENDVVANHSALIGKFNEEEIFYLMSRGIKKDDAIRLLTKGFLNDETVFLEDIQNVIDMYWR